VKNESTNGGQPREGVVYYMDSENINRTTEAKEIGLQPYDVNKSNRKLYCAKIIAWLKHIFNWV